MSKIIFSKGDKVVVRQSLSFRPIMVVKGRAFSMKHPGLNGTEAAKFLGMRCWWFTLEGTYQEQVFDARDLKFYV